MYGNLLRKGLNPMKKLLESITLVEIMVAIAFIGILIGIFVPVVSMAFNPPQEFKYGDEVYIKEGFFKGKSGVVVDKHSAFEYTVRVNDRETKINSGDIKK